MLALDARVRTNKRLIQIEEFFDPLAGTILDVDEMVTEVEVPSPAAGTRSTYLKFGLRKAIDFAIVSVASAFTLEGGTCRKARIVLGGVAPTPYRAVAAEEALKGKTITENVAEIATKAAVAEAKPLSMNSYKLPITEALVKKAIIE